MTRKNAFVLLIDALRYDVLADAQLRRKIAPNIDRIVGSNDVVKVIGLASNTHFVMPSLLSGTYPLDYGGHNNGCKDRPICFPEVLRNAGYQTALFTNCILYNRDIGFDRGFDRAVVAGNSRSGNIHDIANRL